MASGSFLDAQRQVLQDCMKACAIDMMPKARNRALFFSTIIAVCFVLWFFSTEINNAFGFIMSSLWGAIKAIGLGIWDTILALNLGALFISLGYMLAAPFLVADNIYASITLILPNWTSVYYEATSTNFIAAAISVSWAIAWVCFYGWTVCSTVEKLWSKLRGTDSDFEYFSGLKIIGTWILFGSMFTIFMAWPAHALVNPLVTNVFGTGLYWWLLSILAGLCFVLPWFVLEQVISSNFAQTQRDARALLKVGDTFNFDLKVYADASVSERLKSMASNIRMAIDAFSEEKWWRYRRGGLMLLGVTAFFMFMNATSSVVLIDGYEVWIALFLAVIAAAVCAVALSGFITCYPELRKQFAVVDKDAAEYQANVTELQKQIAIKKEAEAKKAKAEGQDAKTLISIRATTISTMLENIKVLTDINSPAAQQADEWVDLNDVISVLEDTLEDLQSHLPEKP